MTRTYLFSLLALCFAMAATASAGSLYDFSMKAIDGKPAPFAAYKGKVLLVVNVASQCGYTPQYKGLESLYRQYKDKGLVVVGIPANNFGGQEPGSNQEIQTFCKRTYDVTFPMYSKVSVAGGDKVDVYRWLTDQSVHPRTGGEVKWNFTKFLVDGNGTVIDRFESNVEPESAEVKAAIDRALSKR